jgi:hypothetical protein
VEIGDVQLPLLVEPLENPLAVVAEERDEASPEPREAELAATPAE